MRKNEDLSIIRSLLAVATGIALWAIWHHFELRRYFRGGVLPDEVHLPLVHSDCGSVSESCLATGEVKTESCSEVIARNKVEEILSRPFQSSGCKDIDKRLQQRCPQGCKTDLATMVMIPGQLNFSFNATPDDTGNCIAHGSRDLTILMTCVR